MQSASRPAFLRRLVGTSARPHGPDLGDMGTALGLDETLEPEPMKSAQAPDTRRITRPVAPWRTWLGRKLVAWGGGRQIS